MNCLWEPGNEETEQQSITMSISVQRMDEQWNESCISLAKHLDSLVMAVEVGSIISCILWLFFKLVPKRVYIHKANIYYCKLINYLNN